MTGRQSHGPRKRKGIPGSRSTSPKFSLVEGDSWELTSVSKRVERRYSHHSFPPRPLTPFRMDNPNWQVILVNNLLGTKPKTWEPRPAHILLPRPHKGKGKIAKVSHLGWSALLLLVNVPSWAEILFTIQGRNCTLGLKKGLGDFQTPILNIPIFSFIPLFFFFFAYDSEPGTVDF